MTARQGDKRSNRLQRAMMEIVVPCAMALSAMAFSAGLFVQGGFGMVSSLIAGVTLFLVMICAQAAYVSSHRAAQAVERLSALEASVEGGASGGGEGNSGHFTQLSEKVGQIDGLSERLQQFDAMAERIEQLSTEITRLQRDRSDSDPARVKRLAAEIDRLDARQEALRSQIQIEAKERYENLSAELQMLETLVKQVAENMAGGQRAAIANQALQELPAPEQGETDTAGQTPDEDAREQAGAESAPEGDTRTQQDTQEGSAQAGAGEEDTQEEDALEQAEIGHSARFEAETPSGAAAACSGMDEDAEEEEQAEEQATLEPAIDELPLIDELRQSIESNRIELHLQPIMTLPHRRVRYYEALTRLRNESGDLLMPKDYLSLAESSGIMSVIDNVMLYRSVQVLRRLEQRSSARGVFCNISAHSLLDPEFFPEFLSFMEQNQTLSQNMFFEFPQDMIEHSSQMEQESLAALAALGFHFSLDHVTNLDLDFQAMHERGFRFMKIDADILLHGMSEAHAQIHAADMRSYLERFGIKLIVSKIEDEASLASVLDYQVKLGQGFVFSEPRPVRPEIFEAGNDAEAAA